MARIAQTLFSPIIIIFVYLWCEVNTLVHCVGLVSILWPEDRKGNKICLSRGYTADRGSITQSIGEKMKNGGFRQPIPELGFGGGVSLVKMELLHHVPCQQIK